MKYLFSVAIIIFTVSLFAAEASYVLVRGKIKSFDEISVTIISAKRVFKIPRSSILPGFQIQVGNFIEAKVSTMTSASGK